MDECLKNASSAACLLAGCNKRFTRQSMVLDEDMMYALKTTNRVKNINRHKNATRVIDSDEE